MEALIHYHSASSCRLKRSGSGLIVYFTLALKWQKYFTSYHLSRLSYPYHRTTVVFSFSVYGLILAESQDHTLRLKSVV